MGILKGLTSIKALFSLKTTKKVYMKQIVAILGLVFISSLASAFDSTPVSNCEGFKDGVYRATNNIHEIRHYEMPLKFICEGNGNIKIYELSPAGEMSGSSFERRNGVFYARTGFCKFKLESDGTFLMGDCGRPVAHYKWVRKNYTANYYNKTSCSSATGNASGWFAESRSKSDAWDWANKICSRQGYKRVAAESAVYWDYGVNIRDDQVFTSFNFCCEEYIGYDSK